MVIYEFSSCYYYQTHINLNLYNNIMNFLQGYCSFHHYLLPVILRDIIVYIYFIHHGNTNVINSIIDSCLYI